MPPRNANDLALFVPEEEKAVIAAPFLEEYGVLATNAKAPKPCKLKFAWVDIPTHDAKPIRQKPYSQNVRSHCWRSSCSRSVPRRRRSITGMVDLVVELLVELLVAELEELLELVEELAGEQDEQRT